MRYHDVDILACAAALPEERVSSAELEERLRPLYERLRLPEGRLELMTGIRERRFWTAGTRPSQAAAQAAEKALAQTGLAKSDLGALLYCGVSRDFVEPATSTAVARELGLPTDVLNFDLSNACLGMLSGVAVLADAIAAGSLACGMVVTGENSRPLVEHTIARLNADLGLTRQSVKPEFASLTIGSAAAAVIVARRGFAGRSGHALQAIAHASDCAGSGLCQGDAAGGMVEGSHPVMKTDSHELLVQGIAVAERMWRRLQAEGCWRGDGRPDLICGHQVGKVHRDQLFARLGLPVELDFPVFPELGNCGSASLPACCALAAERGALRPGMRLAWLGIGSGINSAGAAILW